MIAAFFDCDGTLFSAQFGRGLMKLASDHDRRSVVRRYYASLLLPYALRKLRLISKEAYHRPVVERLAWLIAGWDEQMSIEGFRWVVHDYLLPSANPEVTRRLQEHQEHGHRVILVSAIFQPALDILGAHYQVNDCIGTHVEIRSGRYTGRIIQPVLIGVDKARATTSYLASGGTDIDWNASYAYADSVTDQPILNLVGNPVTVHPDPELFLIGQENHWENIGNPKSQ